MALHLYHQEILTIEVLVVQHKDIMEKYKSLKG